MARQLCPDLVFLPVRISLYQEESRKVFDFVASRVARLERTSIDEAYFEASPDPREAWDFCSKLRAGIAEHFGITSSVGIAPNKMLAKIMSGYRKPNAQLLLRESQVDAFVKGLALRKIPGVGPKAEERFLRDGLRTCGDVQHLSADLLAARYGHWGLELFERCRGRDARTICLGSERKSFSSEKTLLRDVDDERHLLEQLAALYSDFVRRFGARTRPGNKIAKAFVRFKFSDFRKISRETLAGGFEYSIFERLALEAWRRDPAPIRLIGLGVRFDVAQGRPRDPRQLALWDLAS